jgi:hypothetical protein
MSGLPQAALHADAPMTDASMFLMPAAIEGVSPPPRRALRFALAAPRPPDSFVLTSVRLL